VVASALGRARSRSRSGEPTWGIPIGVDPHVFASEPEVWRPPRRAATGHARSLAEARQAGAARARLEACVTIDAYGDKRDAAGRLLPRLRQPSATRAVSVSSAGSADGPGWETDASAPSEVGGPPFSAGQREFGNDLEAVAAAAPAVGLHPLGIHRRDGNGGRRLADMPTLDTVIAREAASNTVSGAAAGSGRGQDTPTDNWPWGQAPVVRTPGARGGVRLADMPTLDELIAREAHGPASLVADGAGGLPDAHAGPAQPGVPARGGAI
jgi:hypothetical protein